MKAITKESLIGKVSSLLNKRLKYDESNDRYYFMKSDIDGFVDEGDISVDIDPSTFGNVVCAIEIFFKKLDRWFVIHLFDNGTISMQENKDSGEIVDYFAYSTNLDDITNILAMNNNNKDKDMKGMNFYTQNGWSGSNYDSKLSTKEIASKVRAYAKKNFPGFKFSVRTEWSMYADSLRVKLVGGPCDPFLFGTRSDDRGYMSTTGVNMDYWENELTPEVFAALYAVTTYASSFRYDDSDAMEDYFDTNFRISVNIDRDEYQVVESKEKKSGVKAEKVEEDKEVKAMTVEGLEIVDYSEKAIAVFGDTKEVKDLLKELGGRFNPSLNYNGEKRSGWVFSKKQADKVKELITPTELPALPEEIYIPELAEETEQPKTLEKSSIRNNLKTLDHSLYDDYEAGLLNLEECARKFAKSGWTNFVDIEYTQEVFDRIEKEAERLNGFTDCNGRLRRII